MYEQCSKISTVLYYTLYCLPFLVWLKIWSLRKVSTHNITAALTLQGERGLTWVAICRLSWRWLTFVYNLPVGMTTTWPIPSFSACILSATAVSSVSSRWVQCSGIKCGKREYGFGLMLEINAGTSSKHTFKSRKTVLDCQCLWHLNLLY